MIDLPLVSIIVTVHNGERYLSAAIESALNEQYKPVEIIVVNDGSTDASAEIIKGFEPNVGAHHQANLGLGAARNTGVDLSKGSMLGFLDYDDLWVGGRLQIQVDHLLHNQKLEAVYGHIENFFSPDLSSFERRSVRIVEGARPAPVVSTMLIRREALRRVGPFTTNWDVGIDMDWRMRAVDLGLHSQMLPDITLLRRIHSSNINRVHKERFAQRIAVLKTAMDRRRNANLSMRDRTDQQ